MNDFTYVDMITFLWGQQDQSTGQSGLIKVRHKHGGMILVVSEEDLLPYTGAEDSLSDNKEPLF